jgi:hypothetical protein
MFVLFVDDLRDGRCALCLNRSIKKKIELIKLTSLRAFAFLAGNIICVPFFGPLLAGLGFLIFGFTPFGSFV